MCKLIIFISQNAGVIFLFALAADIICDFLSEACPHKSRWPSCKSGILPHRLFSHLSTPIIFGHTNHLIFAAPARLNTIDFFTMTSFKAIKQIIAKLYDFFADMIHKLQWCTMNVQFYFFLKLGDVYMLCITIFIY